MYVRLYYNNQLYIFFEAIVPIIKKEMRKKVRNCSRKRDNLLIDMAEIVMSDDGGYLKRRTDTSFGTLLFNSKEIELKDLR